MIDLYTFFDRKRYNNKPLAVILVKKNVEGKRTDRTREKKEKKKKRTSANG